MKAKGSLICLWCLLVCVVASFIDMNAKSAWIRFCVIMSYRGFTPPPPAGEKLCVVEKSCAFRAAFSIML